MSSHAYGLDYDWLIPHNRLLRRLYEAAEGSPLVYQLTKPLWFARYHWYKKTAATWDGCWKCARGLRD